jgi:hypothetical protein
MSQRTDGGFLRRIGNRIGGALAAVVFVGIGVFAIGYGGYEVWVEHTGIPAQVTFVKCHSSGAPKRLTALLRGFKPTEPSES